jgi:hypothetical protein
MRTEIKLKGRKYCRVACSLSKIEEGRCSCLRYEDSDVESFVKEDIPSLSPNSQKVFFRKQIYDTRNFKHIYNLYYMYNWTWHPIVQKEEDGTFKDRVFEYDEMLDFVRKYPTFDEFNNYLKSTFSHEN